MPVRLVLKLPYGDESPGTRRNCIQTLHNRCAGYAFSIPDCIRTSLSAQTGKGISRPHGFAVGVDTLVNFTDHFEAQGVYFDGGFTGTPHHIWEYSMVGNVPNQGGTTTINAPIVAVTLDLR